MTAKFFVSYRRDDVPAARLYEIELSLRRLGEPYIDDLHGLSTSDRVGCVVSALESATNFIAVLSRGYLSTPWTKWEFARAMELGLPIQFMTLRSTEQVVSPVETKSLLVGVATVTTTARPPLTADSHRSVAPTDLLRISDVSRSRLDASRAQRPRHLPFAGAAGYFNSSKSRDREEGEQLRATPQ